MQRSEAGAENEQAGMSTADDAGDGLPMQDDASQALISLNYTR